MAHMRYLIAALTVILMVAFVGCAGQSTPSGSFETTASSLIGTTSSSVQGASVQKKNQDVIQLNIGAEEYLSRALEEAKAVYTENNPSITFSPTIYKNSSDLGELILKKNAKLDILLCTSRDVMFSAEEAHLVDARSRTAVFSNPLALVTSSKNEPSKSFAFSDLARGNNSVAIMSPHLIEGKYAAQALVSLGCFDAALYKKDTISRQEAQQAFVDTPLEGKGSIEENINALVKKIESGDVEFGICYASDVERFPSLKYVCDVPQSLYDPVVTYGLPFSQSEHIQEVQKFMNWCLTDNTARDIWTKWGIDLVA